MRKKITLYGEVAGNIWMPVVECTKAFHLELARIPRNSTTRTYPGIAPRLMEITCLRDALLHLTNDGDFQSCAITWARLEVSHYLGDEPAVTHTVRIRTRMRDLRGQGQDADCFAEVRS
jgi:hypothetical protein